MVSVWSLDQLSQTRSNAQTNESQVSIERIAARTQTGVLIPRNYFVAARVDNLPRWSRLRFRVPSLALHVSDDDQDGVLVVTDTFSRVYGEGEDEAAAINDYFLNLRSHFLDLEQHEAVLAPGLRRDLAEMRRYINSV
jgi:hypothetical protein